MIRQSNIRLVGKKSLGLLFLVPFTLFGENLNQLIELSKDNKMIDSSQKTLESLQSEYASTRHGYLPNLTLGAQYQATDKETSSVPDNSSALYGKLSYTIYDGGRRGHTYDYYKAAIKGDKEGIKDTKNQIALQVTNYYYNYLTLLSQKEAKIKEIEQLDAQQKRLERFLEAGTTTNDEVQKIISRVESANVDLHEIELNIQTILHNLEYTVGRSVTIDKGSLVKEYMSKEKTLRSDIKALEYDMKSLLSNARATKSDKYPTVSVSDTYYKYDLNYDTSKYSSLADDYNQNVLSFDLSWKVFDFGSTKDAYKAAYKKYLSLKSQYEYEKNKASVDLKLANRAYTIAKLKIKSAKAGLKAANSAYVSIKAKYQNGLVDNVAYLEALSEKYDAASNLQAALYDLEIKKADIIYYSGKNIEEFIQ